MSLYAGGPPDPITFYTDISVEVEVSVRDRAREACKREGLDLERLLQDLVERIAQEGTVPEGLGLPHRKTPGR